MAMDSSETDIRETRALAHELWGQCRDATSQYQELTVDLRRLRNLLEDVEEHIAEDPSLDISQISTPIMQCKAILCGLELNLKSFQDSAEEQRNVQPEVVLVLKASVQVASHNLSVVFESLTGTGLVNSTGGDGLPSSSVTQQPSHSRVSRKGLSTATNVKLRVRNSAKMISLSGGRPVVVATDHLSMEDSKRELNQSPYDRRGSFTVPPMPADWHSPFSVPDPLAYESSRACTILTDPRIRPIPKIVFNGCNSADKVETLSDHVTHDHSSPEVHLPALEDSSNIAPELYYSENSPSTNHESEASAGAASTTYVPYRPWYEPIKKMDSHLDMYSVQELSDSQHEAEPASMENATPSTDATTEQKNGKSSPPVPIRSSLSVLLSQIARSKRKPPVPPRRRRQSCPMKEMSHTPVSLIARTGVRVIEGSISGLVKLPYLDELKHVLKGNSLSQARRASAGENHVVTYDNPPISVERNHISRARSMELIVKPHVRHIEMRRTRSASVPELTTSQARIPIVSHLFELPADSIRSPVESAHTVQVRPAERDHIGQIPDSLAPSLMLSRVDHICACCNSRCYSKAESYLTRHLSMVQHDHEIARKVRHLLDVCASYRGQWQRALMFFISVINKPVRELDQLDCGDKAAFYWLGDTYALLNRNEEALLARCLRIYQERLRLTVSKSSFKDVWTDASFQNGHDPRGSIAHCTVVTQPAAQTSLESQDFTSGQCSFHSANKNPQSQTQDHTPVSDMLLIAPSHLESTSCWPMPHDPTFNFQGVLEGSLIAKHIDILTVLQHHPEALYFSRCFLPNLSSSHCVDIRRLITAVRESLQSLAMRWHEIVSRSGVFFLVQYDSVDGQIATMDCFRVEATRFSLRNGFGLNFCSENTNRARRTSTYYHTNGSLDGTTKRELKRCLRSAIESACARQVAAGWSKMARSSRLFLRFPLPRVGLSSPSSVVSTPTTPPRESTESSNMSPAELETTHSDSTTPQSSVDLSTLVPPIGSVMPARAQERISVRSSYNERHLTVPVVR
ncbi:hypothetical protein Q7P35_003958 [Cladosporium inversicolor]